MVLQRAVRPVCGVACGVAKRCMSTAVLPQEAGTYGKEFGVSEGFQISMNLTVTPRGLLVASLDNLAPVSRVMLAVHSGPRFEMAHEQGAGHALRALAYLSSHDASQFGISRTVDAHGAKLHTTSTREATLYGVEIVRDKLPLAIDILNQIGTQQVFKPWETEDAIHTRLTTDLAVLAQEPHKVAIEMAHRAAFRTGLGRSLYCPEFALKTLNADILHGFVVDTYTLPRMTVVGLGVDHEELVHLVKKNKRFQDFNVNPNHPDKRMSPPKPSHEPAARSTPPSKFHAGKEVRDSNGDGIANVTLVFEGCAVGSKDVLALGVLQRILGAGPSIKYSVGTGRLVKSVTSAVKAPVAASCLNANYSDAGLFGVHLISAAKDADVAIKATMDVLRDTAGGNISDQEIEAGKQQLKASLYMASEHGGNVVEDMAVQALFLRNIVDLVTVSHAIDALTPSDIKSLAAKVLGGKPSMGALGGIDCVPYLDEL